jgi:ABC-type bacteriocin/lantibiotic exporter with double-glycine peptidase domain
MNINNQQDNQENIDSQARQIAGLLDTHANHLSMRTFKQLENARERAVKLHTKQVSNQHAGTTANADGTLNHLSAWVGHHRAVTAGLVVGAMLAGFILMQSLNQNIERGDAFLLGDELPPEAFVDRGFEPSLNYKQAKL